MPWIAAASFCPTMSVLASNDAARAVDTIPDWSQDCEMRQRPPPRKDVPPTKPVEREPIVPPTIGFLLRHGVSGFRVACTADDCRRSNVVTFEAACLSDETLFPMIERRKRVVCSACGNRQVHIMPDWPSVEARAAARTADDRPECEISGHTGRSIFRGTGPSMSL